MLDTAGVLGGSVFDEKKTIFEIQISTGLPTLECTLNSKSCHINMPIGPKLDLDEIINS